MIVWMKLPATFIYVDIDNIQEGHAVPTKEFKIFGGIGR
jgi:hypothetical protein